MVTLAKSLASKVRADINRNTREIETFGMVRQAMLANDPTLSADVAQTLTWRLSENDLNYLSLAFGALTR
jgi:hypothetical protein